MTDIKINLLVIDDDEINVFIIKKIASKTGYTVNMTSKSNGQLGIDYLNGLKENSEQFPQLILVDINMPLMNGWEFLEAYEKLYMPANTHVYMVSSSVYENDIEKAKSYKAVSGFISKPLSLERLTELLRQISH
ncbi:MAG TPA: response regulator [Pedobacter sp.]|nr:response regulator [Pedobacter sp.]